MNKPLNILKTKTCKVCKTKFTPARPLQTVCSPICGIEYAKKERIRAERIETRSERVLHMKARESIKTRSEWLREAQNAFNAYIRERDKDKPCISCGSPMEKGLVGGGYDCGHYRSVGSAPHLRFDERNAMGQCKKCNRYLSGNAIEFRSGLVNRYGIGFVEGIESDNEPKKYTIDELKDIKSLYKSKLKALKNG